MRGLLDNELLNGPHEVTTRLRPERLARPVVSGDMPALLDELRWLCQVWGGAGQPVIPISDGQIAAEYQLLLQREQIDHVRERSYLTGGTPHRVSARSSWDYPAVVLASKTALTDWNRATSVVELEAHDPWLPIYAATLGTLPNTPNPKMIDFAELRKDLKFEEVFPVKRRPAVGSLEDLLTHLEGNYNTPRQMSNVWLAYGQPPHTGIRDPRSPIPEPNVARRTAGSNIIVAVSPGSVEDIALLWNLRAAHGDRHVLPIGIPISELTPGALEVLSVPGRARMFGFEGGRCHLTSTSVSQSELEIVANGWRSTVVVKHQDLLFFGPAPGRPHTQVGYWTNGVTRLDPLTAADRDTLYAATESLRKPRLILDVQVQDHLLPIDTTMRGHEFDVSFRAGMAQVAVSELRRTGTIEVAWPPSWTSLAAVAKTKGLRAVQSDAGLAVVALLRSLGSIDDAFWLQHKPLVDLLYRLAERSGMAWWKKKWAEVHKKLIDEGAEETVLEAQAEALGRDEPAIAPPGEGRFLPFDDFRKALGGEQAAIKWVNWAERRHLLVRGAKITCSECASTSWLPMASLPPPVGCSGCGREIDQPYGPRGLTFTYRIGEPLRRVLETDSLGHLSALHWLTELYDRHNLVGAHPGVDFIDESTGKKIGEADVLLLFADGSLVPVEVKRRIAGIDQKAIGLMDTLSDALQAPYDVLAVTQPARDCVALESARRTLPDRPRLVLTDDQMLTNEPVVWLLAKDPFVWSPRTSEEDAEREITFTRILRDHDPETAKDTVSNRLLKRSD
ncbi:hypothetical protein ACFFQW_46135 [Umezawaea endophytica]|uniref:Uncharacterized protein n=1 Tax=Umezawaea endophytica TaxID=1654476 RepID=A0A9X3A7P2_9PSEU|nr:hypothetical protein [Umezawaea endophytica]MCS7484588.1 hypothetical protein [Umezawaea endophytica]